MVINGVGLIDIQEQHMDNCLRQILQQEVGYGSDLSNNDVLSTKVAVITDAERVQDCTNEHVFAHDSELGISF
jgi:hypothetical protein